MLMNRAALIKYKNTPKISVACLQVTRDIMYAILPFDKASRQQFCKTWLTGDIFHSVSKSIARSQTHSYMSVYNTSGCFSATDSYRSSEDIWVFYVWTWAEITGSSEYCRRTLKEPLHPQTGSWPFWRLRQSLI